MKLKTTIYLILIAIFFIGYVFFYEKYKLTTNEIEINKIKPFTVSLEKIQKITLINSFEEKIRITRDTDGDSWSLLSPLHVEADGEKIEEMVNALSLAKSVRTLKSDKNKTLKIEEFGLKKPRVELTILSSDKSLVLSIGKKTPLGENMYVMLDENPNNVYLFPNDLFEILNKKAEDIRNKKVTYFDVNTSTKLEIVFPSQDKELTEVTKYKKKMIIYEKLYDGWYMFSPPNYRADEDKINNILNKLNNLTIVKFVDNDPSYLTKYGLAEKDRLAIQTNMGRKKFKDVLFGQIVNKEENWGYTKAFDKNYIYLASHNILSFLPENTEDWRDKKVIRFDPAKVIKLKIENNGKILYFSKQNTEKGKAEWFITEPVKMKADDENLAEELQKMSLLSTEEFVTEDSTGITEFGLSEPEGKISFEVIGKHDTTSLSLFIGKKGIKADKVYLKNSKESSIFVVTLGALDSILQDYMEFKDHYIWEVSQDKIVKLNVNINTEKAKDNKNIEFGKNRQWMMDGKMVNPEQVNNVLFLLHHLRAIKYITLKKDLKQSYGLDKPQITVSFMTSDNSSPGKLLIGDKTKFMTYYAKIEGKDEVFTIGYNLYNLLLQKY
ncbi:DUF4340 domain-containing protein [Candidatus Desantisbacteria bacterium]|nr:DUF4340 domain-containing protein [Candidatus Desantisbacteria bacterium]